MSELLRYSDDDEISPDSYLFHTQEGDIAFVILEEEMLQLNNFCCLFLNAAEKKMEEVKLEIDKLKAISDEEIPNSNGFTYGDMLVYKEDFELITLEDTYSFLSRANCVLLLSIFTEKSLRTLCAYLGSSSQTPKQLRGKSKIDSYLSFLQKEFSLEFDVDDGVHTLISISRRIRNDFAHGEWDKIRSSMKNFDLQNSFRVVTNLFESIEMSYENKRHEVGSKD